MATLYDISTDLLHLAEVIATHPEAAGEQSNELESWFADLLQDTQAERDRKLDHYAALIAELESRAQTRKQEADRLLKRARRDETLARRLRQTLTVFFQTQGLKTLETQRYRLTLAMNGGKLPLLIDETYPSAHIPDRLCRISREPNPEAIRAALASGETLPFAQWGTRQQQIRIY